MQEIVVFKFDKIFHEQLKQKAEKVAKKFPGVTSAVGIKNEYSLTVTGEFVKFKLMKKLSKLDKNIDIIKIEPVQKPEPQNVQRKNNPPKKKEEKAKPPQAGSWNWPNLQPLWDHGKNLAAGLGGLYNQKKVKQWPPQQNKRNFPVHDVVKGTDPLVRQVKQIFAGALWYVKKEEVKEQHPWNKRVQVDARDFQRPNENM